MEATQPQDQELDGQEEKGGENQDALSAEAPRQSPKRVSLTGMRRVSPKKLKESESDLAAGAVPSLEESEADGRTICEERKSNAKSKALSVVTEFTKGVKVEYRFHKLSARGCEILFPSDDGKSGDMSDASEYIAQLLDQAANPAHDECRLVASVTNQEFLLVLSVASFMKSNAVAFQIDTGVPAVQVRRVEYLFASNNANKNWRKRLRKTGREAVDEAVQAIPRTNPAGKKNRQVWLRIIRPKGRAPVTPSGIMANDPGVRTCATTMSTRGDSVSFLSAHGGDGKVLEDLAIRVDGIQSRMMMKRKTEDRDDGEPAGTTANNHASRVRQREAKKRAHMKEPQDEAGHGEPSRMPAVNGHKRRYRMRVAKLRVYKKAKDKIRDAHCKYVKFVTEHAEGYLDPRFGASQMAPCSRRASRKGMSKSSVRTMLNWCTYKLRMRMQQKAKRTENFLYVDCLEAYTSCTCSECGTVRPSFREEIFQCVNAECGLVVNRDQNAAKNIIIRSGFI